MLIIVLTGVGNLASLFANLRRKPPVSEELYKDYLPTRDHDRQCAAMKNRIDALDNHNSETHVEIFNLIRAEREWATESIRKMTIEIQNNMKALDMDLKTLERGLGRVEGALKPRAEV
jgi:hypothetical protein